MLTNLDLLHMLAQEYERQHLNDTDEYKRWLLYGFACASFGEAGREPFKTFSRSSSKYKEEEANRQYNACIKAYRGEADSLRNLLSLLKGCNLYLRELLQRSR